MKTFRLLPLALAVLMFAGCDSIDHRIKEKASTFAALDAATQAKVRKGTVEIGFTPDMVYMALGAPDERRVRTTAQGRDETWVYTTSYEEYAGTAHLGYRRVFVRNPRTGATYVYLDPVYTDVYQNQTEERIRIVFRNEKVVSIEDTN